MDSYIKKIRAKLGTASFIQPAARIIVENEQRKVLIVQRKDNGNIGLPAGSLEENETIEACIIREVKEETGLELLDIEVIGISSNPEIESVAYPNGDKIQYFTVEFYSNRWKGELINTENDEVKTAKFVGLEALRALPKNEISAMESLAYYRKNRRIMLK